MFWRVTASGAPSELVTRTPSAGCALSQGGECQRPRAGGPEAPSGRDGGWELRRRLLSVGVNAILSDSPGHRAHPDGMCPIATLTVSYKGDSRFVDDSAGSKLLSVKTLERKDFGA